MFSSSVVLSGEDPENTRSWISVAPRTRRHSQDSHKRQAPDHLSKRNFRDGMVVSDLNPYDGGSRSVHLDQVVSFSYRDSLVRQFSPQSINSTLVSGSSTTLLVETSSLPGRWKDSPLELRGTETLAMLSVSMSRGPCPRQSVISKSVDWIDSDQIDQSINQLIYQSTNQSINQSVNRSSDQSINQSLGALDSDSALCKFEQKSLPPPD